jgi:hypothetical protein
MRSFLGLAALAAISVNGQQVVPSGPSTNQMATIPGTSLVANAQIDIHDQTGFTSSNIAGFVGIGATIPSKSFVIYVVNSVSSITFNFLTNSLTAQMQYRWLPNYPNPATLYPGSPGLSSTSYTCDPCAGGTAISCPSANGPAAASTGFACASLARIYTFSGLQASIFNGATVQNSISVQLFDLAQTGSNPDTSSYSFVIIRAAPAVAGDPQISGLQGQDFQVHGTPDEIFNMITYPNLQVNARFVYLSHAECHDNFTTCFAHPGTYISEEGIRLGKDKIHVQAGSYKKGLTVSVNGQRVTKRTTALKLGAISLLSHRQVVISSPILAITISNSDKFLNQQTALVDSSLLDMGRDRRVLAEGESFHSEIPLHGLQGQTWRNVEYPSGLEYEGSIQDYHIADGNLFGSKFTFNQYKH